MQPSRGGTAGAVFPLNSPSANLLAEGTLTRHLVLGSVLVYVALLAGSYWYARDSVQALHPEEALAAGIAATVLWGSVAVKGLDAAMHNHRTRYEANVSMLLTSVHVIAAISNTIMAVVPMPVVADPQTGVRQHLARWCEFSTLAFIMTFCVEAIDAPGDDPRGIGAPLFTATMMGVSTACGLLLPFCTDRLLWALVMWVSFATFWQLFPRLRTKVLACRRLSDAHSIDEMERSLRMRTGRDLLLSCAILWSLFVALYCASWLLAVLNPRGWGEPLWPFIADCLVDVLAKLLYAHQIGKAHFNAADQYERQNALLVRDSMSLIWAASPDTLVISRMPPAKANGRRRALTLASPSLVKLLGEEASCWLSWHSHELDSSVRAAAEDSACAGAAAAAAEGGDAAEGGSGVRRGAWAGASGEADASGASRRSGAAPQCARSLSGGGAQPQDGGSEAGAQGAQSGGRLARITSSEVGQGMLHMVSLAWAEAMRNVGATNAFEWTVQRTADSPPAHLQVHATLREGEQVLVIVLSDCTDRVALHQAEKALLVAKAEKEAIAQSVARQKDEEANRFTRHEVKNGVLAVMAGCESLRELHERAAQQHSRAEAAASAALAATDRGHAAFYASALRAIGEMASQLERTLNTVLAEAMTRDLVHGAYNAEMEAVALGDLLASAHDADSADRFAINLSPNPFPVLELDPRVLFHIYRNAISNACKYGRKDGLITANATYDFATCELSVIVINEAGPYHDKLLALADPSCVFEKGMRLHSEDGVGAQHTTISSGDGAWVMRMCSEALGGSCSIVFAPHATIFSFGCAAKPHASAGNHLHFRVPPGTVGVGIDDSKVQRLILKKMFGVIGCDPEKVRILGATDDSMLDLSHTLQRIIAEAGDEKVVVISDENLELNGPEARRVSGSLALEQVKLSLSPAQLRNTLLFVRSANDSREDCERYKERAHAVLPKRAFERASLLQAVAAAWEERFGAEAEEQARPPRGETWGLWGEERSARRNAEAQLVLSMRRLLAEVELSATTDWDATLHALQRIKEELSGLPHLPGTLAKVAAIKGTIDCLCLDKQRPTAAELELTWRTLSARIRELLEQPSANPRADAHGALGDAACAEGALVEWGSTTGVASARVGRSSSTIKLRNAGSLHSHELLSACARKDQCATQGHSPALRRRCVSSSTSETSSSSGISSPMLTINRRGLRGRARQRADEDDDSSGSD